MAIESLLGHHKQAHTWRFFRAGGFDQVRLDRGSDLCALEELDQKLWLALSCPTRGLEFDSTTLDLIDTDNDGRIRVPEILAAVKWACASLKNPDDLLKGAGTLELGAINDATDDGKRLLAAARAVWAGVGKPEATSLSVEDSTDTAKFFAQSKFNGDGIVPADSADDPALKALIEEIISCVGGEPDASGKPGISEAKVTQFWAELQAYSAWWAAAQADAKNVLPLGEGTLAAGSAIQAARGKVDDYFVRCRLADFDARANEALNCQEKAYLELAAKDLTITMAEITAFPLALADSCKALPLKKGLNPAWAQAIEALRVSAVMPVLGDKETLTEQEWRGLTTKFEAYDAWQAQKAGAAVEKLGLERVRKILAGKEQEALLGLIAQDKAREYEMKALSAVARLVRYQRDLFRLLNNYVNFRDFYTRSGHAIFQAGTLYLDQRSCDLCVRVDDMAKHGTMAHLSYSYLAYCEVVRKATGEKMTIAAAMMNGDSDNLMVGRNGIFYDRQGRDWDATIVKIVDNPISIRQAFWSPYKRLARWIEDQIAKRAAAADSAADSKLLGTATSFQAASTPAPGVPATKKLDVGVVAALGVAAGAISAACGTIFQALTATSPYLIPLYAALIMLAISTPSMILAAMKLRQRNLGPILDANGWAVNAKAKINIPFGASLTQVAKLPPGSHRDLVDPYHQAERWKVWTALSVIVVIGGWAAWYFGGVERVVPDVFPKSSYVKTKEEQAEKDKKAKEEAATKPAGTLPAATQAVVPGA